MKLAIYEPEDYLENILEAQEESIEEEWGQYKIQPYALSSDARKNVKMQLLEQIPYMKSQLAYVFTHKTTKTKHHVAGLLRDGDKVYMSSITTNRDTKEHTVLGKAYRTVLENITEQHYHATKPAV